MKSKRSFIICIIMLIFILLLGNCSFAVTASKSPAISAMQNMGKNEFSDTSGPSKIGTIINTAIGIIQYAGSGLAVVMVSILGIKYLIAAPSDKADVKKQILPLVIGCAILFASVNLVQIVANFTETIFK